MEKKAPGPTARRRGGLSPFFFLRARKMTMAGTKVLILFLQTRGNWKSPRSAPHKTPGQTTPRPLIAAIPGILFYSRLTGPPSTLSN